MSAASMETPRWAHAAVRLADGRVLIAGGLDTAALCSAEVWDPADCAWTACEPLARARHAHTLTVLPDGRVLAVGGIGDSGAVDLAELWDPRTGRWNPAGELAEPRAEHTATLLPDGRVLVCGGRDRSGHATAAVEVWDPARAAFAQAPRLPQRRIGHVAVALGDGRVLVAGGATPKRTEVEFVAACVVRDPATGRWSPTASLARARADGVGVVLQDARVLLLGGFGSHGAVGVCELFDPRTDRWSDAAALWPPRARVVAAQLADGDVVAVGGEVDDVGPVRAVSRWRADAPAWRAVARMDVARAGHTATALADGRVLVAGGVGAPDKRNRVPRTATCEVLTLARDAPAIVPDDPPATPGFTHVTLFSPDAAGAAKFYGALFGWTLSRSGRSWTHAPDDGPSVTIQQRAPSNPEGWVPFATPCDVEACADAITRAGGRAEVERDARGTLFGEVRDPGGALVALVQAAADEEDAG